MNDAKKSLPLKVVLTGGPSAGKTTVAQAAVRAFNGPIVMIPEAASILFGGGFLRSDLEEGVRHQQMAIYKVQREHEAIFRLHNPHKILVCDRGTLDGEAYWPKGHGDFFEDNKTTLQEELSRYDLVIHLDTASEAHYDTNNRLRTESLEEANHINEKVRAAWEAHPRRFIISASEAFHHKIRDTLYIFEQLIAGCPPADLHRVPGPKR